MLTKTANASRAGTALGTQRRAHRISREHVGATAAVRKAQRISCERGQGRHPGQSRDCPARRCFQRPERARAFRLGRLMPDHADCSSGWSLKTVAAKGILVGPLRTHHTLPGVERQASDVSPGLRSHPQVSRGAYPLVRPWRAMGSLHAAIVCQALPSRMSPR